MTIHPGYSGQAFQARTLDRVRELRSLLPAGVRIQVDGGVSAGNIARLRDAGVSLFVAGGVDLRGGGPGARVPRGSRRRSA